MVISATAGAAPTDHALPKASSPARSSWRTWPHIKDRSHVPTVDGADTANGNTTSAEPARSRSVSSMNEPPTSIDATTLSAFAPDPRPAPGGRTAPSMSASNPRRSITVPASNNPASATKDPSSNTASISSIPPATLLTGSASSRGQNDRRNQRHSPTSGGLSGGRANPTDLTEPVDPGLDIAQRLTDRRPSAFWNSAVRVLKSS